MFFFYLSLPTTTIKLLIKLDALHIPAWCSRKSQKNVPASMASLRHVPARVLMFPLGVPAKS